MKHLKSIRTLFVLAIAAALFVMAGINASPAEASGHTFNVTVTHSINGKDLGLDKELPVNVFINGALTIPDFTFGEVVSTQLPAGTYTVEVQLLDGTPLSTMTVGPVNIPGGLDVDIKARLSGNGTPYLQVQAAESMPVTNDFKVKVRHNINGRDLGLPRSLPVNVYINGVLVIPGFEYGDTVEATLPSGNYTITVTLLDGTPLPTMVIENAEIPGGASLAIKARLDANGVPFLNVLAR